MKLSSILGALYLLAGFGLSGFIGYAALQELSGGRLFSSFALGAIALAFGWYSFEGSKQFAKWLAAIPQNRFTLTSTGVEWPGGYAHFQEIQHIRCHYVITRKRQNFMDAGEDHNIVVTLALRSGKKIDIVGGQGTFTWFGASLGKRQSEELLEKLADIQRQTFDHRLRSMVEFFRNSGHLLYDGKKIDAAGSVHFDDQQVPLSQFWLSQDSGIELISRFKNGAFHKSAKLRSLHLTQDRDVFLAFVKERFGLHWPTRGSWAQR